MTAVVVAAKTIQDHIVRRVFQLYFVTKGEEHVHIIGPRTLFCVLEWSHIWLLIYFTLLKWAALVSYILECGVHDSSQCNRLA